MRKIISHESMAYNPEEWKKLTTWGDFDTHQWRGSKIDQDGNEFPNAIDDPNIMFALRATVSPANITLVMKFNEEPTRITMSKGAEVLVGRNFIYYDDYLERKG